MTFDLRYSCALNLVLPQLAVLLQLVQLWAVLGRLGQPLEDDFDLASNATNATPEDVAGAAPPPMHSLAPGGEFFSLEAFQLTSNELQNLVALQCIFEGAVVRVFFATATPLMPLVLLLACCFLEIFSKGMGTLALKRSNTSEPVIGWPRLPQLGASTELMSKARRTVVQGPDARSHMPCIVRAPCPDLPLRNSGGAEDHDGALHRRRGWGCPTTQLPTGRWFRQKASG